MTIIHGRLVHSGFGVPEGCDDQHVIFVYVILDVVNVKEGYITSKEYNTRVSYILETLTDTVNMDNPQDLSSIEWPQRHMGCCMPCQRKESRKLPSKQKAAKAKVLHACNVCEAMMCFACLDVHGDLDRCQVPFETLGDAFDAAEAEALFCANGFAIGFGWVPPEDGGIRCREVLITKWLTSAHLACHWPARFAPQ